VRGTSRVAFSLCDGKYKFWGGVSSSAASLRNFAVAPAASDSEGENLKMWHRVRETIKDFFPCNGDSVLTFGNLQARKYLLLEAEIETTDTISNPPLVLP